MYIRTLGHVSDDEGKYQSEDAARRAAQELFKKYESECKGIDVLKRLTKQKLSVWDEATLLRRRIAELPQLFRDKAELDRRAQLWLWRKREARTPTILERGRLEKLIRMPPELYRKELATLLVKLGYPPDALPPEFHRKELATLLVKLGYPPNYILRDLNRELRQARCEHSLNSLRFAFPCGGMEVDDPKAISGQVAEHYVQTELGSRLSNQRITCSASGRSGFCDVHFPQGITIRVNFSKVPYALIAVQVAPKVGPLREYSYSCFGRKVNLSLPTTP